MWIAVAPPPSSLPTVASVVLAVQMADSRLPRIDWWCAAWARLLHHFCKVKQPMILRDKEASLSRLADEAEQSAHDPRRLYTIVKQLAGARTKPLQGIQGKDGKEAHDQAEIT